MTGVMGRLRDSQRASVNIGGITQLVECAFHVWRSQHGQGTT